MKKRTLIILIPSLALLANGTAYFIVRSARTRTVQPATTGGPASGRTSTVVAEPAAAPSAPSRPAESSELVQRRRAVALAALEGGEYGKALANFEAVKEMGGADAHLDELIRVTEELLDNSTAKEHPRTQVSRAEAPRPRPRAEPTRRSAAREPSSTAEVSPQPAPSPATGTLIVTTTPRGLLVRLDDSPLDLTPMRAAVKPGSHRIALSTAMTRCTRPPSWCVKPRSRRCRRTSRRSWSRTRMQARRRRRVPSRWRFSLRLSATTSKKHRPLSLLLLRFGHRQAPRGVLRSRLDRHEHGDAGDSFPGLYGVVWINGRPRGYPPLEVTDLPAGPAKVEVRVNGIEKRSSTVVVEREKKVSVTLRPDNRVR